MEIRNNPMLLNQTDDFMVQKKMLKLGKPGGSVPQMAICARSVGDPNNPLFLIIHGSEFIVRYPDIPLYIVAGMLQNDHHKHSPLAVDCPGYGESGGSKQIVRSYPALFIEAVIQALKKQKAFALMGHSQGGAAVFNAHIVENPKLADVLVQERPVGGDLKRLSSVKQPTLLIFDTEDRGHPISQGRIMRKYLPNNKFVSYTNSRTPYWQSDNLAECIIGYLQEVAPTMFPQESTLSASTAVTTPTTTTESFVVPIPTVPTVTDTVEAAAELTTLTIEDIEEEGVAEDLSITVAEVEAEAEAEVETSATDTEQQNPNGEVATEATGVEQEIEVEALPSVTVSYTVTPTHFV